MFGIVSRQISWDVLATFCRSLGVLLDSGVSIVKAIDTAGRKTSANGLSSAAADIRDRIKRGDNLSSAFKQQHGLFPDLLIEMVTIAEETGTMPETLESLASHYENLSRLKRTFVGAITMPLVQFAAAILIVAGLIWLLGMIGRQNGGAAIDVLQLGLTGEAGAIMWLVGWGAGIFAFWVLYQLLTRGFKLGPSIYRWLLKIPVAGACLQSFAIARFAWAFALTQEAGMPIRRSMETSLRATGNPAFAGESPKAEAVVQSGGTVGEALAETKLFPREFLEIVYVGETSGTVPELFRKQSAHLEDDARRKLAALTTALGWVIWGIVAMFIVFFIFKIALFYVSMINDALKGI